MCLKQKFHITFTNCLIYAHIGALISVLTGCDFPSASYPIKVINDQYKHLNTGFYHSAEIHDIKILDVQNWHFNELAVSEKLRLTKLNNQLEHYLDILYDIEYKSHNAFEDKKLYGNHENTNDNNKYDEQIQNAYNFLEKTRILIRQGIEEQRQTQHILRAIDSLSEIEDIIQSKNTVIWHEVNYSIENIRRTDSIYLISFDEYNLSYLNKNIFYLENSESVNFPLKQ